MYPDEYVRIDQEQTWNSGMHRSRAGRNGNWKMASRDWLEKATNPHLKFQN
jgi:hypothetical protein